MRARTSLFLQIDYTNQKSEHEKTGLVSRFLVLFYVWCARLGSNQHSLARTSPSSWLTHHKSLYINNLIYCLQSLFTNRLHLSTLLVLSASVIAQEIRTTPCGIQYGVANEQGSSQPVLFVFALDIAGTLDPAAKYNEVGRALYPDGFLIVSLDLPCHGADVQAGEYQLSGWRKRIEAGRDIVTEFAVRAKTVLDYLISIGSVDPSRVYAAGTSRGGFMALQLADNDPRVTHVAAFCPVTELTALSEFDGFAGSPNNSALSAMSLDTSIYRLSSKHIRIYGGPDDTRVGTGHMLDFVRRINNLNTEADLHYLISPAVDHFTPTGSHQRAAEWIRGQANTQFQIKIKPPLKFTFTYRRGIATIRANVKLSTPPKRGDVVKIDVNGESVEAVITK